MAASPRQRVARWILLVVAVIGVVVLLFDWNWLRAPVAHYISEKSGRVVRIGDMHVAMGLSLAPTVRLRDVYVENAQWADKRPLIVAKEVAFTFALKTLWDERTVVSRLVLVDAEVDMHRRKDGLRNWRLTHPEDRGPGTVTVLTLEARRSQLRFHNENIDLELTAVATDVDRSKAAPRNDPFVSSIRFTGAYQGARFEADTLAGELLTFRQTGVSFPARGQLTSGKTRLDFDGLLTDVFDLGPMDLKVRVAGATLSALHPFLKIRPAPSGPYAFEARLTQAEGEYKLSQLKGRIGSTELTGDAIFDRRPERPIVHATLSSPAANVADLLPLVGVGSEGKTSEKPLSTRPFRGDALKAVDARINVHAAKLHSPQLPMLESLRVTANLTKGVLELKPIDLGLAGGHVSGTFTFNAAGQSASASTALAIRRLQLEKLVPSVSAKTHAAGVIDGEIKLSGHGNSVAAMRDSATGSLSARMAAGRISNLADAKLGLNGGKLLSLMLRGDRDIAINCGAVDLNFQNGVGKSKTIALDTEQTHVDGAGTVDLHAGSIDAMLTPSPKKRAFLARDASIRVHGPFGQLQTSVQDRVPVSSDAAPCPRTRAAE